MPRHNNKTAPATAMNSRNRVLVRNTHIALVGGSWALATFQLMPPLGRSMARARGVPRHHRLGPPSQMIKNSSKETFSWMQIDQGRPSRVPRVRCFGSLELRSSIAPDRGNEERWLKAKGLSRWADVSSTDQFGRTWGRLPTAESMSKAGNQSLSKH